MNKYRKLHMNKTHARISKKKVPRVIKVGDICFVNGYKSSKVQVIEIPPAEENWADVLCLYLIAPVSCPDKLGEHIWIRRQNLYPRGER